MLCRHLPKHNHRWFSAHDPRTPRIPLSSVLIMRMILRFRTEINDFSRSSRSSVCKPWSLAKRDLLTSPGADGNLCKWNLRSCFTHLDLRYQHFAEARRPPVVTPSDKTGNDEWLNSIHFSYENAEENSKGFILWLTECSENDRILKTKPMPYMKKKIC